MTNFESIEEREFSGKKYVRAEKALKADLTKPRLLTRFLVKYCMQETRVAGNDALTRFVYLDVAMYQRILGMRMPEAVLAVCDKRDENLQEYQTSVDEFDMYRQRMTQGEGAITEATFDNALNRMPLEVITHASEWHEVKQQV